MSNTELLNNRDSLRIFIIIFKMYNPLPFYECGVIASKAIFRYHQNSISQTRNQEFPYLIYYSLKKPLIKKLILLLVDKVAAIFVLCSLERLLACSNLETDLPKYIYSVSCYHGYFINIVE